MVETEWTVIDPIFGSISLGAESDAFEYATKVGGIVERVTWEDGEVINRKLLSQHYVE